MCFGSTIIEFEHLPAEILHLVMALLDLADLRKLTLCSRRFRGIFKDSEKSILYNNLKSEMGSEYVAMCFAYLAAQSLRKRATELPSLNEKDMASAITEMGATFWSTGLKYANRQTKRHGNLSLGTARSLVAWYRRRHHKPRRMAISDCFEALHKALKSCQGGYVEAELVWRSIMKLAEYLDPDERKYFEEFSEMRRFIMEEKQGGDVSLWEITAAWIQTEAIG